jgi:uncharacterized membrane protein YhaH (DUF805 family)
MYTLAYSMLYGLVSLMFFDAYSEYFEAQRQFHQGGAHSPAAAAIRQAVEAQRQSGGDGHSTLELLKAFRQATEAYIEACIPEQHMYRFFANIVCNIFAWGLLLPTLAVAVRRLHDVGKSAWWLLISLVPFFGALYLLYLMVKDSQPDTNEWGSNPKADNP